MKVLFSLHSLKLKLFLLLLLLAVAISPYKLESFQSDFSSPKISQQSCQRSDDKVQLNPNTRQQSKCPDNCIQCTESMECTACEEHYFLQNGKCSICDQNCWLCQTAKQYCILCETMKFLDQSTHTCKNCIAYCLQCIDSETCFQCNVGYFYSETEKACVRCGQYCQKCKSVAECEVCEQGYYFNEKTKYCNTCDQIVEHCMVCINGTQRTSMKELQNYQNNNALSLANSLFMQQSVTCAACLFGYFLVSPSQCASCVPKCESCINKISCQQCSPGYVFNQETKLCQVCNITFCSVCLTPKQCWYCQNGYFWNNVTRIDFPACEKCRAGCQACGVNYCTSCERNYYLVDQTCLKCSESCLSCSVTPNNCTTCSPGYFLLSNTIKCVRCPTKCLKCRSQTICDQCAAGFRLSFQKECLPCTIKNCTYCSLNHEDNDKQKCSQCAATYYLATNTSCQPCIHGCSSCRYSPQTCVNCLDGYFINADMNSCQPCPVNCLKCVFELDSKKVKCRECEMGYYSNQRDQCIKCNISKCISCFKTLCFKCVSGYFVDYGNQIKCSKCNQNCTQCSNGQRCSLCKGGFYLDKDFHCVPCHQGCRYCDDLGRCLVCDDGYTLDLSNSSCLSCTVRNCLDCTNNSTTCLKCITSYTLQTITQHQSPSPNSLSTTTTICYSCGRQYLLGCSQCQSSSKCIQCIDGYVLNNNNLCENEQTTLWPWIVVVGVLAVMIMIGIGVKVKGLIKGKKLSTRKGTNKSFSDTENYHRLEQLSVN